MITLRSERVKVLKFQKFQTPDLVSQLSIKTDQARHSGATFLAATSKKEDYL